MKPRTLIIGLVVFFGLVIALGLATESDNEAADATVRVGGFTQMERSGEVHEMLEEHRIMLERMQADVSPAMRALMDRDPMWQMLRSGEWARLDVEHQRDIDRMLGLWGQ